MTTVAITAEAGDVDGVWHFLNKPRPVVVDGIIHFGFVDSAGNVRMSRWHSADGRLIDATTVRADWRIDDHLNPAVVRLPGEGGQLLATAARGGTLHLFYANPADPSSWTTRTLTSRDGNFAHPVVYADRVLLIYRDQVRSDKRPHFRISTDGGQTFGRPRALIDFGDWLYPQAQVVGDDLHLLITSNPVHRNTNPIYYVRVQGNDLFSASGHRVGSLDDAPLPERVFDVVYPADADAPPARAVDMTVDGNGNPVILHVLYHAKGQAKQTYRAARWTGREWRHDVIADTLALDDTARTGWVYFGGLCFHPRRDDVVYASVMEGDRRVIRTFKRHSAERGWQQGPVVACGQRGDALRPWTFTADGGDWLMWLDGDIKRFNAYDTVIRLQRLPGADAEVQ